MAEPFSLATGALSTVALGIRVCGELYKYLGAIKERHKELAAAWDTASTLGAVFEHLDAVVTRISAQRPEDAALLARCLEDVKDHLLELQGVVRRLKGWPQSTFLQSASGTLSTKAQPSGGLGYKARQAERAMTYSFHRDGLKGLLVSLNQLATCLNCGIVTAILKENEELVQNVRSLQTMISTFGMRTDSRVSDVHSDLASLASEHKMAADDLQAVAQENLAALSKVKDELLVGLSHIKRQNSTAGKAIRENALGISLMREEAQIHGKFVLARLHEILGQLEQTRSSAANGKENLPTAIKVLHHLSPASLSQAVNSFSWCQCQVNTGRSTMASFYLHNLHIFSRSQTHSKHKRSCSLYAATQKRTREVGANVRVRLGLFLSYLIEVSFWYSTSDAGGCSFGPALRWKNLVPKRQSLVYQELSSVGVWLLGEPQPPASGVLSRLRVMQQNVLALYQRNEASIDDVDELGNNHLQNFVQLVVRWMDHKLLELNSISIIMSMISFYTDWGLICSERDTQLVTPNVSSWWNFLPSFKASTTLAKTIDLIVPYGGGRTVDQIVRLVSSVAQASDPVLEDFAQVIPYLDPGLFFTRILDYENCVERISPLARAIINRSIDGLKSAVKLCPEDLLERTQGLTVLHLAVCWPSGLSFLLESDAKCLLDTPDSLSEIIECQSSLSWPFSYAAASQCAQSLDILLHAGCDLNPTNYRSGDLTSAFSCALQTTSSECAEVFASHMALRRKELLALARSNLDRIMVQLSSLEICFRDTIIAHIEQPLGAQCNLETSVRPFSEKLITTAIVTCLERAMVPIPTRLHPSGPDSEDIYHLPGMCLAFFPIFERHGFHGYNEPNQYGLRPIMADVRSICSISRNPIADNINDLLLWLIKHGCLDMRPVRSILQPRAGRRLNEGSTGWHYTSLLIIISQWGRRQWWRSKDSFLATALTRGIETIAVAKRQCRLDGCTCWCNPQSTPCRPTQGAEEQFEHGCSPFSFLCKQYLRHDTKDDVANHLRQSFNPHDFWHYVFRHGNPTSGSNEACLDKIQGSQTASITAIPPWQLELVRLLTFEALEMTHTCCSVHQLQPGSMELAIFSHPDPERTRHRLIKDPTERGKPLQLEELMVEFTRHLSQGTGSPRDLELFICGPWRARVAGLYHVCHRDIKLMEDFLGCKVQTRILPATLQKFFGVNFPFFDECNNPAQTTGFNPAKEMVMGENPLHCNICSFIGG